MRSAGEIAGLETDVVEHPLYEGYMFGLAAVRSACNRELFISPAERVESSRLDERDYLEKLGARAPEGEAVGIPRPPDDLVAGANYRPVDALQRFNSFSPRDDDIEIVGFHPLQNTLISMSSSRGEKLLN